MENQNIVGSTEWLQGAFDSFLETLDEGNYELAEDIIKDVNDKGYSTAPLIEKLLETPIYSFSAYHAAQR